MKTSLDRDLKLLYKTLKPVIEIRIKEFTRLWTSGSEDELFQELAFCLMTPQSSAKACWEAVGRLFRNGLFYAGAAAELSDAIHPIRFKHNKARYMVAARSLFLPGGVPCLRRLLSIQGEPPRMREWLVKNVKGLGFKEAGHFLRNIGLGEDLAILDRHILRTMNAHRVLRKIPDSINRKPYLLFEKKFKQWADRLGIPPAHLDLLIWYQGTGYLFK